MKRDLTDRQARLLADQINRLIRKWQTNLAPLDQIYLYGAKQMAAAGRQCGYEFEASDAGVSWHKSKPMEDLTEKIDAALAKEGE